MGTGFDTFQDMLQTVLNHGGLLDDVHDRDTRGNTPLLLAASQVCNSGIVWICEGYVEDCFTIINLLIDRGAGCNSVNYLRRNFFHLFLNGRTEVYTDVLPYRPYDMLTAVLVRVIEGGGGILAADVLGRTPSDAAKDNHYEHSWREALSRCGYSPQDVYTKSGVSWTELEEYGPEENLIETLAYMARQWYLEQDIALSPPRKRQWRPETLQQLLRSGIQTYGDLFLQEDSQATMNILRSVRAAHADDAFRKALATCGYDAQQIYNCAGIPWVELDDISYEDCSSYENAASYVDASDDEYSDEEDSETDEFVDCESGEEDSSEDGAYEVYSDDGGSNLGN
jgi:hypothetical protein